ncbi:MAG TPA: alpha/beta fold hydrolase [Opitutaceae bacterium]
MSEASSRIAVPDWLASQYPFQPLSHRTAKGAWMSYVDEGPRTDHAVVFLHGNPTWSFYFRRAIAALSSRVRCIAPDHVGMGLSDKPPDYDYSLAGRIADVAGLIDRLRLTRVDLVLHDWGGAIGMGWAVDHEPLVGRIALLNTAAFPSLRIPWRIAVCRWPVLGECLVRGANGFAVPALSMAMSQHELPREVRRAYLHPYDSWANRVGIYRFVRDIPMELDHPTRPTIERIARELPRLARKPMWIGWGGKDFCFNRHFLERWRELFPKAETRLFPKAGHYVLEDAGEAVLSPLQSFLLTP